MCCDTSGTRSSGARELSARRCGVRARQHSPASMMLSLWLRYTRAATAGRQRLVAEAMGRPGEDAADVIAAFVAGLGLPRRLAAVGGKREQFAVIAAHGV